MHMDNQYKRTTTTVSFINYHFVFCPRFRRKIFDIPGVEERFKELVSFICEKNAIEILAMECHHDHAHLFLSCLPAQSPSDVMKFIKRGTSKELRSEFSRLSRMPDLWTRSFFVSTAANVSSETILRYVASQKARS